MQVGTDPKDGCISLRFCRDFAAAVSHYVLAGTNPTDSCISFIIVETLPPKYTCKTNML